MWWRALVAAGSAALLVSCGEDDAPEPTPMVGVAIQVCGDVPDWRRPPLDDHRAYVIADPRWRAFGARNLEQYEAHFWGAGHSASGAGFILEFSGMWNLPNEGKDFYRAALDRCFADSAIERDEYLPLWLFEHEIVSARESGGTIEVKVRPRETGVQIISLRLPGGIYGREQDIRLRELGRRDRRAEIALVNHALV
jgi:hypothetical protein